jgi:hypothetical protein
MRRMTVVLLLGLAACAAGVATRAVTRSSRPPEWQLPSGLRPSRVEYAALLAACRDKMHSADSGRVEACLTGDYGLRRVP